MSSDRPGSSRPQSSRSCAEEDPRNAHLLLSAMTPRRTQLKTLFGPTRSTSQEPEAQERGLDGASGAPDSNASLAEFVIGEVRDHLRDIHLEISALRATFDTNTHETGIRKREPAMERLPNQSQVDLERVNVDHNQEGPQRPTFTAQRDDPPAPAFMDIAVPLRTASSGVGPVVGGVLTQVDSTPHGNRTSEKGTRSMESVVRSDSTSKFEKRERLASLYDLELENVHRKKHPKAIQKVKLSLRGVVTKNRLSTRLLETFMSRPLVQAFVMLCVFLNSVYMGMTSSWYVEGSLGEYHREPDAGLRTYAAPTWTSAADVVFSVVFLSELLLRVIGQECRFFFGEDWRWNAFDCVVEMLSLIDLLLLTTTTTNVVLRTLRLLKVARALRTVRMLRHLPWMDELRFMTLAIFNSVMPLLWACVVITIFLFVISIVLVQGVALHILDAPSSSDVVRDMEAWFGSLEGTMLTLFMSMTGGIDWSDAFRILSQISWFYGLLFTLFIACSALAVLNIITSIFVSDAIDVAHRDFDLSMRAQIENSRKAVKELTRIFGDMDVAKQDIITSEMLEKAMQNNQVRAQFGLLGLEITDAVAFFQVLDVDGTGQVDASEFVMGCLRLKGHTTLIDVEVTVAEIKMLLKQALAEQRRPEMPPSMLQQVSFVASSSLA